MPSWHWQMGVSSNALSQAPAFAAATALTKTSPSSQGVLTGFPFPGARHARGAEGAPRGS
jgi:hypothetical protein